MPHRALHRCQLRRNARGQPLPDEPREHDQRARARAHFAHALRARELRAVRVRLEVLRALGLGVDVREAAHVLEEDVMDVALHGAVREAKDLDLRRRATASAQKGGEQQREANECVSVGAECTPP